MGEQRFLTAEQEAQFPWDLAGILLASEFRPDIVLSVYRGGCKVGPALVEALRELGDWAFMDYPVIARRYTKRNDGRKKVQLWGLEHIAATTDSRILLVEDLYDRGITMRATRRRLVDLYDPAEIKVAAVLHKEGMDTTGQAPDFFIYTVPDDPWIVYTHEKESEYADDLREERGNPRLRTSYPPLVLRAASARTGRAGALRASAGRRG